MGKNIKNEDAVVFQTESKKKETKVLTGKMSYLTASGVLAAMITIMTAYICHIPVGMNGGYIHFGDALIYLGATLLPWPYAMLAAAIGGGVADLLTAPMWAPATIIIKMLITIPFSRRSSKIITVRNVIATIVAFFISAFAYYLADFILFGAWTALLASLLQSAVQGLGSAIIFIVLGVALDKIGFKRMFLKKDGQ